MPTAIDRDDTSSTARCGGFTFLEILVALLVLTILIGVLFHAHSSLIVAHEHLSSMEQMRFVAAYVAGENWLGRSPEQIAKNRSDGWMVASEPVDQDEHTTNQVWNKWAISPSNYPSQTMTFFLKVQSP